MSEFAHFHFGTLCTFLAVFARVGALVWIAPVFGSRWVPLQVRLAIAFCLALMIAPSQFVRSQIRPDAWIDLAMLVGAEVLVGAALGLGVLLFFTSFELAGGLLGRSAGINFAEMSDSQSGAPFPGQLLQLLALVVFLGVGGHRLMVQGLMESFQAVPLAAGRLPADLMGTLVILLTDSFQLAIRIAAPALTAVLGATLFLGMAARVVPQLNTWTLGLGLNLSALLGALLLSLSAVVYLSADQVAPYLQKVFGGLN